MGDCNCRRDAATCFFRLSLSRNPCRVNGTGHEVLHYYYVLA